MPSRERRPVTPRARSGFRFLTAGVTGLATFGALTATGAVAGEAAHTFEEEQAQKQAEQAAAQEAARRAALPKVVVVDKRRPHKTIVRTRVVGVPGQVATTPGSGGNVRRPTPVRSGGGSQQSAPAPAAPAAPPAPPAPPAPSSGS